MRPLSSPGVLPRIAPFAVVMGISAAVLPIGGVPERPELAVAAVGILALLAASGAGLPWRRLPAWTEVLVPASSMLASIYLMRESIGPFASGYAALAILPGLWVALYGKRSQVLLTVFAVFAVFATPVLTAGQSAFEVRRAALFMGVCSVTGPIVHGLVRALAARQSSELEHARLFAKALDVMLDPVIRYRAVRGPDRKIVDFVPDYLNRPAAALLRASAMGRDLPTRLRATLVGVLQTGEAQPLEFGSDEGSSRWFEGFVVALTADHLLCTFREVTDKRAALERLTWEAHHDALTGLANRRRLLERIDRALEADAASLSVLFIDVDRFKAVNDDFGHEAGDDVLVEVAHRLAKVVGAGGTVGRLGGDEFVVLLTASASVGLVAERIAIAIAAPIQTRQGVVTVSASLGHVTGVEGASAPWLLEEADRAMYVDKFGGSHRRESGLRAS